MTTISQALTRMTLAAWAVGSPLSVVESQAKAPPATCQEQAEFRQFDFWIGEWTVTSNNNGAVAGENRIESREGGCVLVEQWTGKAGGTGISLNYYDSITKQWRQVWVANNYSIDIAGGLNADGAMVLVGEIHSYTAGQPVPFRGTWTPNADGSVRQLFEQQDPKTGEWKVWFDGRYVRKS